VDALRHKQEHVLSGIRCLIAIAQHREAERMNSSRELGVQLRKG
jgi:hypothetical protein